MSEPGKGVPAFKPSDSTQNGKLVFMLDTTGVPSGVTVSVQGNILGNSCISMCDQVTFTLCAGASLSAAAGKYDAPVILRFGSQDGVSFGESSHSGVPTVFIVGP
jgi:hypothetical protein